jgi:hypothetical protein
MTEDSKRIRPTVVGPWWWLGLANRPGSRRLRRRLVIGTYAVWLVFAAIVKLADSNLAGISFLMAATLLLSFIWLGSRRYVETPSIAGGQLDERLTEVGNLAMKRAYQIFTPLILSAWPLSLGALYWQPNEAGRVNAYLIWIAAFLLGTTLPTVIVAWREPDPAEAEKLPA